MHAASIRVQPEGQQPSLQAGALQEVEDVDLFYLRTIAVGLSGKDDPAKIVPVVHLGQLMGKARSPSPRSDGSLCSRSTGDPDASSVCSGSDSSPRSPRSPCSSRHAAARAARRVHSDEVSAVESELSWRHAELGLRKHISLCSRDSEVAASYKVQSKLGEGGYGSVHRAVRKSDGQIFALKSIKIEREKDADRFDVELGIAGRLSHPNINRVHEAFALSESKVYHLVLSLCTGGSLRSKAMNNIRKSTLNGVVFGLHHKTVARYLLQAASALAYMHHHGMAHRDIKADNFMLESSLPDAQTQLIDFGFARDFSKGEKMMSQVGSLFYIAPEVVAGMGYDEKCDVWGLGIVGYFLAVGQTPFTGEDRSSVIKLITSSPVEFPRSLWVGQPSPLREVITELLQKDPERRPSAKGVCRDNRWLRHNREYEEGAQPQGCCTVS